MLSREEAECRNLRDMRSRELIICGSTLGVACLLVGCGASVDEATPSVAVAVGSEDSAANVNQPVPATPADTSQRAAAVEFTPPFPERTELFEPPKRAQSTVRRDDESGNTVELKGFINVAGPKAVLSIDGVITPISVGDEKYGVQVISIDGPSVVLQRGRSRWTATLE
jgi:hypothetical protein